MSAATPTLRISGLAKNKVRALNSYAKNAGISPEEYAKQLIEDGLERHQDAQGRSIDELWAPVREEFQKSGMTEAELDELVDAARRRDNRRQSPIKGRR